MLSKKQSRDHPVFSSEEYESWLHGNGTRILYLQGPNSQENTLAGEQICLEWVQEQQTDERYHPRLFSFLFSSHDPSRNLMGMLAASFLHFYIRGDPLWRTLIEDQYKLQHAWLEEDLVKLTEFSSVWLDSRTPFLLLDLDECDVHSRKALWALLGGIASRMEEPVKFIVTSKRPWALRAEVKRWPDLQIHEFTLSATEEPDDVQTDEFLEALISRHCPKQLGESRIRRKLEELVSMDRHTLTSILHLVEGYSKWPAEIHSNNLDLFCSLIEDISSSSTPRDIIYSILSSVPDRGCLQWLLSWILTAKRPLSLLELSMMRYHNSRGLAPVESPPEADDIQVCLKEVGNLLRGFICLHDDKVHVHPEILDLIDGDTHHFWSDVKNSAPETTTQFLLTYLGSSTVQQRLRTMYCQYLVSYESAGDEITPPIVSDGRDAIFYAVEALPHHLSGIVIPDEVRHKMRDPSGPYESWAKVYWAMCNPFSRAAKGPLKSAWATWEAAAEFGLSNMVRRYHDNEDDSEGTTQYATDESKHTSHPSGLDRLIEAVRADNEDLALHFAGELISNEKNQEHPAKSNSDQPRQQLSWPLSILWRATWLDMHRLVQLLLENGLPPDDQSSASSPSPLFMAARLGHSKIVKSLILHGADMNVKMEGTYTSLHTAAANGHAESVRALVVQDNSQRDRPQPDRPLYTAARRGAWKSLEVLLEIQADPNLRSQETPSGEPRWTPIIAASSQGFAKTLRLLLESGADPNTAGPNTAGPKGRDTPLYNAAIIARSLECVRLLLGHKADPNHEMMYPLLHSIMLDSMPDEFRISLFNILMENDPPVLLENAGAYGMTALIWAAWKGDIASVRWLLRHGVKINTVVLGKSALFEAVVKGHKPVVQELLSHHETPRLDLIDGDGCTLLQEAIGDDSLFEMLLDAGADPEFENKLKQTALNIAVVNEEIDAVELLLEPGRHVDIHHRDINGCSPILNASGLSPNPEMVRILMESGANLADTDPEGMSPLHWAARKLMPDILRILLEFHVPEDLERRNTYGETPLLELEIENYEDPLGLECIFLLVRAGSDVNAQDSSGRTILMRCASSRSKSSAIEDFLLALRKVAVNAVGNAKTALHCACRFGNVDMVDKLLEHDDIDVNIRCLAFCDTPLIAACMPTEPEPREMQDVEASLAKAERIVRELVAHGADVDATAGPVIFNALCAASLCSSVRTVNYLLDKSALTRQPDPLGRLPIHFAAANGLQNFEAVSLVHGDDIMKHDNLGRNVLHWAAQFGHVKTVESILQRLSLKDRKAYVNARDIDGWTPLAWATKPGSMSRWLYWTMSEPQDYAATIKSLIDYGADISVQFRIGQSETAEYFTPLEMAKRCAAGGDVIQLLTPTDGDIKGIASTEQRKYKRLGHICCICFSVSLFTYLKPTGLSGDFASCFQRPSHPTDKPNSQYMVSYTAARTASIMVCARSVAGKLKKYTR